MSVVITTYTLASGLMASGMNWWQALLTITLGNLIVLIPMVLNAHAGVRYGIPFPVFVRASFGIRGANIAAIARALVACGWFGIQTWLGALALDALLTQVWGGWADIGWHRRIAFAVFWLFPVAVLLRGMEGVKYLEAWAGPLLLRSRGANIAAIARALVACGWFGIQTWLGALALDALLTQVWGGWADIGWHRGIAFAIFWLFQVAIILRGMEGIKYLESWAAPLLLGGGIAVLIWAFIEVGSISQ